MPFKTIFSAVDGKLEIAATGEFLTLKTSEDFGVDATITIDWMKAIELRNTLTKAIDNKRARDRYKFK